MRRYIKDQNNISFRGKNMTSVKIKKAFNLGLIPTRDLILKEDQRLDHLAYKYLGNDKDWWILALLSNIGWPMQVPAGTIIKIPTDIQGLYKYLG